MKNPRKRIYKAGKVRKGILEVSGVFLHFYENSAPSSLCQNLYKVSANQY